LQLARVRLGIGDELRHRIDRQVDMDCEADDVRAGVGNGREVLHRVERRIFVEKDVAGHDGVGADHQRVAVGRRARHIGGGDIAAHAGPVVDDDGLTPSGVEPFGHGAREQITGRARRIADHDGDRPGGIILRHRRHGRDRDGKRQRTRKEANEPGHVNVLPRPTVRTGVIVLVPAFCRLRLRSGSPILSDKAAMKKASAAMAPPLGSKEPGVR